MGIVWSKIKLSDFSLHPLVRSDYKYINYKKNVEVNYSDALKVKNIIKNYYKGFAFLGADFKNEGDIYAIKGTDFNNDFSIDYQNASFLPVKFFENPKYQNFKISKYDIIVSLVGSIGKMVIVDKDTKSLLNQNNIALQVDNSIYNNKLFAYLLKQKISVLVNSVYKNSGYSFLAINDLFDIKLPKISISKQNDIVNLIKPLEQQIKELQVSKKEPLEIINEVFAKEFDFDFNEFERLKKQKIVTSSLLEYSNNKDLRFGYRFQHQSGRYMMSLLKSKTFKRIKDYASIPIMLGSSVSPSQYDENGDYYYISMATVKKYYFDKNDAKKVSKEYSKQNLHKTVQKNDIIVTRSGMAIGKFALIQNEVKGIFADFTMRIRLENYNYQLAYYYFRSLFFQQLITTNKKGLQNHNIFPSQIQEFPIPDWNIEKQNEVCQTIKTQIDAQKEIDNKIEEKQNEISKLIENTINENANA